MKVKEIIRLIEEDGWRFDRQKGSHKVYVHPTKPGHVVIPDHGKNADIKKGTEYNILRHAGLK
jgi:predicted RNA binding protein YcfA (HicA-like mRNA interferase family)